MPITKSAKKAHRVSLIKKAANDRTKKVLKEGSKAIESLRLQAMERSESITCQSIQCNRQGDQKRSNQKEYC